MAKRARTKASARKKKAAKGKKAGKTARKAVRTARKPARKAASRKPARKTRRKTAKARAKKSGAGVETLRTPPSSLDLPRGATAAHSGRVALNEEHRRHRKMDVLTAGDLDADAESAYYTGDETPGGENPTPDQSGVDELGHALGVEYQDNQELQGGEEVAERDKHRWDNE